VENAAGLNLEADLRAMLGVAICYAIRRRPDIRLGLALISSMRVTPWGELGQRHAPPSLRLVFLVYGDDLRDR